MGNKRDYFKSLIKSTRHDPSPEHGANSSAVSSSSFVVKTPELQASLVTTDDQAAVTNDQAQETRHISERKAIDIPPDELWDHAYDGLKTSEPELLEGYEKLLSMELLPDQTEESRLIQMDQLLNAGLDRTAKIGEVEGNIGEAIKIVLSVKQAISVGLTTVPIAAAAWTGICVGLEIFSNAINEASTNRDGITKVTSKMKWYSSLTKILHQEAAKSNDNLMELREMLAERVFDLYKTILRYIIKTVCTHHRNQGLVFLRGMVKWDDWKGSLSGVNEAEKTVKAAADEIGIRQTRTYLEILVNMHQDRSDEELLRDCYVTDMDDDIRSLQARKDKLLPESYKWVLETQTYKSFTNWDNGSANGLLWMRGDAGKGKTMLLMGIVEELKVQLETHFDGCCLSYFFCRATEAKVNTATSVLRGLIWMLVRQEKSLIRHLYSFKVKGSNAFNDDSVFYSLRSAFRAMLQDSSLRRVYLVIDALDECKRGEPGMEQLLELITETAGNDKVKWLLSSRNEDDIEDILANDTKNSQLCLEVNSTAVSEAVDAYINRKVSDLRDRYRTEPPSKKISRHQAQLKAQREAKISQTLNQVSSELKRKAGGTFLWVALVVQELKSCTADELIGRVEQIPTDLDGLYTGMLVNMINSKFATHCKKVLLVMTNAYRPLHLSELIGLANLPIESDQEQIVRRCGFLALGDDNNIAYFVHQSAKDYLVQGDGPEILSCIFPNGHIEGHHMIVTQSLECMKQLQRDIYGLERPGFCTDELKGCEDDSLLESLRYSCVYWADHLCASSAGYQTISLRDDGPINEFWKTRLLYWLEALSLMGNYSVAVYTSIKLVKLMSNFSHQSRFLSLIRDSHRFILSFRGVIEKYPLQTYISALVFAPMRSLTRENFKSEQPDWLTTKPIVDQEWSQCVQTLYGHTQNVISIACSPVGDLIASASRDLTIKIWEEETGQMLQSLLGHTSEIYSVTFSPTGRRIASCSMEDGLRVWDVRTGECLTILQHDFICSAIFSPTGQIASVSTEGILKIWTPHNEDYVNTITIEQARAPVAFLSASQVAALSAGEFAPSSNPRNIGVWNPSNGEHVRTLEISQFSQSERLRLAVSTDGLLVSGSDSVIEIWSLDGDCLQTIDMDEALYDHFSTTERGWGFLASIAVASDGNIISGHTGGCVCTWDGESGDLLHVLSVSMLSNILVASTKGGKVVTSGGMSVIKVWEFSGADQLSPFDHFLNAPRKFAFLPGMIAQLQVNRPHTVLRIWDTNTQKILHDLRVGDAVRSRPEDFNFYLAISSSLGGLLALAATLRQIEIWDPKLGKKLMSLEAQDTVRTVDFSPDESTLLAGLSDGWIQIWNWKDGTCSGSFQAQNSMYTLAASSCGNIASQSENCIKIWRKTSAVPAERLSSCYAQFKELRTSHSQIGSLSFSADSTKLLLSYESHFIIWDINSGKSVGNTEIDKKLAFENAGRLFFPSRGPHYALDKYREWITCNEERVLWLPEEYRPSFYWHRWAFDRASAGNRFIIECGSHQPLIFGFLAPASAAQQAGL